MPRLAILVIFVASALSLAAIPAAADPTPAGGANNVVLAATTAAATTSERSGTQVAIDAAPTAASANVASASATDCTGCRSVAAAIQVVVVEGSPSTFAPANAAIATNSGCTSCTSYAYANQDVIQVPGPVYLTANARAAIETLRTQIAAVAASGLSPDEMTARFDALALQLDAVVESQLVAAGTPFSERVSRSLDDA